MLSFACYHLLCRVEQVQTTVASPLQIDTLKIVFLHQCYNLLPHHHLQQPPELYQFAGSMPLMFVPASHIKDVKGNGNKRKRDD